MSLSQESNLKLATLRAKQQSGQALSVEELRDAIQLMREARGQAHAVSAASKVKGAKKAPVNSDALLQELEGL